MNIHDDDGIKKSSEDSDIFNEFCAKMGLDPDKTKEIPFNSCGSIDYAYALEDIALKKSEDVGVDFWWLENSYITSYIKKKKN